MTVDQLKTKLYALFDPLFSEVIIWADQSAPRPPLPYVTLRLGVISPVGEPHYSDVTNAGIQTVLAVRESILSVQRFGNGSVNALELLSANLCKNSVRDLFSVQDISAFDVSNVTDIAALQSGIAIEPRASLDVSLRWTSSITDNVGVIDTVVSDGEVGPIGTATDTILAASVTVTTVV